MKITEMACNAPIEYLKTSIGVKYLSWIYYCSSGGLPIATFNLKENVAYRIGIEMFRIIPRQ